VTLPPQVQSLVDRFQRNVDDYVRQGYNETQARREFIDPLFAALGWDMDNAGHGLMAYGAQPSHLTVTLPGMALVRTSAVCSKSSRLIWKVHGRVFLPLNLLSVEISTRP
jgi:hypothetical protein